MKPNTFILTNVFVAITFVAFAALPVQAAEFMGPDDQGLATIPSPETHKNLYVAGGTVMVNGKTTGDLYAAGGTVNVDGEVEQDLVAAGGTVIANGKVGGDIRMAGGTVTVNAPVAGDVVVCGGTIVIGEKGAIGGDLVVSSGSVTVNGQVAGKVWVKAGQLTFGSTSEVKGQVVYQGKRPAVVKDGAKIGTIENRPWEKHARKGLGTGILSAAFLLKLLAYIVAGLLLIHFFPRKSQGVVENIYRDPWRNLGIGLLALIVLFVAGVVLTVTLVGAYVGIALLLWLALVSLIACLLAPLFLGSWLIKVLTKKPDLVLDWQAVVIGTVIYLLLAFIPVLGWLAIMVLFLMAFGSLARFSKNQIIGGKNGNLRQD